MIRETHSILLALKKALVGYETKRERRMRERREDLADELIEKCGDDLHLIMQVEEKSRADEVEYLDVGDEVGRPISEYYEPEGLSEFNRNKSALDRRITALLESYDKLYKQM